MAVRTITLTSENCVKGLMLYLCKTRVVEAILIVIVTTASVFIVATFLGTCVRENTLTDTSDCPGFVSLSKFYLSSRSCSNIRPLFRVIIHLRMRPGAISALHLEQTSFSMTWLP